MPLLVLAAAAWGAGLVVARQWLVPAGVGPIPLAILCLVPVAAGLLWRQDHSLRLSSVCTVVFLLGTIRFLSALPEFDDAGFVAHYNGQAWAEIEGVVRTYPDVRDSWVNLYLDAEWITIGQQRRPVSGRVLVRAPLYPQIHYGDRLRASGLILAPPETEEFSYRDYLAGKGVYSLLNRPRIVRTASGQGSLFWTAILSFRDRAGQVIVHLLPDPEAALLRGILLGVRSGIPSTLYSAFNATSTSHIVVISGANIVIVSALFTQTFGRLMGRRRATWVVLAGLTLYVLLVGADAPVVRAGVMAGLFVMARYLGRESTAYVSLCASALFLTAVNPLALWDLGFQLSFVTALSLIVFSPALRRFADRVLALRTTGGLVEKPLRLVSDVLVMTLAAQLLANPLIVYTFRQLSLAGPLANVLIAPVQPLIMTWGGAATIVGFIPFLEPIARLIAWVAWLCLAYTLGIVRWLAGSPIASLQVSSGDASTIALGWCTLLLAACLLASRHEKVRQLWSWARDHWSTKGAAGILSIVAALVWLAVSQLPDGRLHVAVLDVGQGDATFITTPKGQQILVDGGPSPAGLTTALGREMAFWDHSIDLIVLTHPDADHMAGLPEVLRRYEVEAWLDNGQLPDDALSAECLSLLMDNGVLRHSATAGDRFDLGDGLTMEVVSPPPSSAPAASRDVNNSSVLLRIAWDQAGFLLTGDIGAQAERLLLQSGWPLRASVLKVAHHGSAGSSTSEFLEAVRPEFAVISVGADNHSGHPAAATLERLAKLGHVTILRTDERGRIEFVTDGQKLWIQTER